eukprot:365359-Chlamydomonas_euryale.AAC.9
MAHGLIGGRLSAVIAPLSRAVLVVGPILQQGLGLVARGRWARKPAHGQGTHWVDGQWPSPAESVWLDGLHSRCTGAWIHGWQILAVYVWRTCHHKTFQAATKQEVMHAKQDSPNCGK